MSSRALVIVTCIIFLFVGMFFAYQYKTGAFEPKHEPAVEQMLGQSYAIEYIEPLGGNEFDIRMETGMRIHAFLEVDAPPRTQKEVVQLLSTVTNPVVILIDKDEEDQHWLVDVLFTDTTGRQNVSLTATLQASKSVWE